MLCFIHMIRNFSMPSKDHSEAIETLCKALVNIDNENDMLMFLKDLTTPNELASMSERWQICLHLAKGMSYRDIQNTLKSSLTTIGRVARFLHEEDFGGYRSMLKKTLQAPKT